MQTGRADQVIIPHVEVAEDNNNIRWFSDEGCVVRGVDGVSVFVGTTLINSFSPKDKAARNLTLVGLAKDHQIRKGKLAEAFGIGAEQLRRLVRRAEEHGVDGIRPSRDMRGRKGKVTPAMRKRFHALFDEGFTASEVYRETGEESGVSYRCVCRARVAWAAGRQATSEGRSSTSGGQVDLCSVDDDEDRGPSERVVEAAESAVVVSDETKTDIEGQVPRSCRDVRYAGGWLLVSMVGAFGLHRALLGRCKGSKRWKDRLRVVVDAVIIALGIGQRCVEGVRRLESQTGGALLRARRAPSESWTRRVLKKCVDETSTFYAHLEMTQHYLALATARSTGATVFYIDNHLRPYTGKHTIRKGWRMQDKRVLPGATDYYVHDEDGRPVYRMDVPSNDTLTGWLSPVARVLRAALGESERILLAFDRGGAFPEQLMKLREEGFEFVTYERRPYQELAATAFSESVTVDGESYGVHESRQTNLGKGRGRVRRIVLRTPAGRQVNLLAFSEEKKERLIEVMLGRWVQENGFKHGNERWGINHLDQRKVEAYPPDTVIPNPARRRLDNALRLARHREGDARNQLARMRADDRRRAKVKRDLEEALAEQRDLETQRPTMPKRAPLKETELKEKLVFHTGDYKTLIDTIRIACANAESELALTLSPSLRRPQEAKKVLANLFAAPGDVRVNGKSITVTLEPTGNRDEQEAIQQLLQEVSRWKLTLPGDAKQRPLRFRSHFS